MSSTPTTEEWRKKEGWPESWSPLPAPKGTHQPVEIKVHNYKVTPDDIEEFKKKGYWMGPKLFSDQDVARLREEAQRVMHGEVDNNASPYEYDYWLKNVDATHKGSKAVKKINNGWWINETIRSVVTSKEIGEIAAQLLGEEEIRLWHDQVISKPGTLDCDDEYCGNIGWHQDYAYWQISSTSNMITAWIALQDTDLSNGTLMTITSSHHWGLVPGSASFFDKDMGKLEERFKQYATEGWDCVPSIMKAGQVAFHHALTFHGSGRNNTLEDRLAIAVHMQPGHCSYRPAGSCHHNLKDLGPFAKEGDLFVGPAFPVLFRNSK